MPGNKSKIVHIIFAMMLQIQSFEFEMPVFAVFSIAAFQSITLFSITVSSNIVAKWDNHHILVLS